MITEIYSIEGMSCAACSSAVERVTRKLAGVKESSVNLTTAKMTITYDESVTAPAIIMEKVSRAGFTAIPQKPDTDRLEQDSKAFEKEEKQLQASKARLITALCFAIPLLYLSMGHMLPFPLPLPRLLQMDAHPFNHAIAQLLLTIPVLGAGSKFFLGGLPALFKGNPNMDSLVAIGTGSAF
ncbi:MAG: cation transporter, partial [Oscillospiraceae bacterium]